MMKKICLAFVLVSMCMPLGACFADDMKVTSNSSEETMKSDSMKKNAMKKDKMKGGMMKKDSMKHSDMKRNESK